MGPVYLAQFTIEINQNVGKYTIHGSYGCVCILLLSSSNKMSAVWGRPKDCLQVRSERKSACWLFFKTVILFLWLALRRLIVLLNLTLLLKSPPTSMKWKGWRYNIPEITWNPDLRVLPILCSWRNVNSWKGINAHLTILRLWGIREIARHEEGQSLATWWLLAIQWSSREPPVLSLSTAGLRNADLTSVLPYSQCLPAIPP